MKPEVRSNPRVKKPEQNRAHNSATSSLSMFSGSRNAPGWIIQTKNPPYDEPQWICLCQWVVKRLQAARNPEKLQTKKQDLNKPLILRHYTDVKAKLKDRGNKDQSISLVNGMPHIPEVRLQKPVQQKLHYRLNDGSSFIYYPSGCMAVCQSHSGLTCGGFYTNVFSDAECPVVLATITAFGHGAVTHPLSSAITAVWDQDGGFMCDHYGNITEEWSWQTDCMLRGKIDIQLSDQIFVRLFSAMSAMLSFRCDNESVQLPLSSLSNQLKERCLQSDRKFTSDAIEKPRPAKRTTTSPGVLENMRNLTLTPVSVCSQEVPKKFTEVEGPEALSALWKRGGHVSRELRRLQQRVRTIVEDWLDYYRVAIGIKCPDTEQIPEAPLRTRVRRDVQSAALPSLKQPAALPSLKQPAALPSLKPPEQADAKPVQPEKGRNKVQKHQKHLSPPAERRGDSLIKIPRAYKMKGKKDQLVTLIGPLQIYGNIKPESVILLNSPESETSTASPAVAPLTPSIPLTVCPALLRAVLQGEGRQKRCCCSATLMPTVTDLEYDAFIMGQPPHSQQILVVCVTQPCNPVYTHTVPSKDPLEDLYEKRNKHRTMPCTQCQMDSFRLVRYQMSTVKASYGLHISLLQQRHNAAPGMVLMYIRGKLLFVDYILSGHSCSARDLQKQISRTRADYRLGLSLVSDYKFSIAVNVSTFTNVHSSSDATGDDITPIASEEKETTKAKQNSQIPEASLQQQIDFSTKPRKTPTSPPVPVITH
ncbi:uncharacterized protein C3orf20-like [Brachyistius frenatus]|uniref:uncharacterized protein C3orf20-like n=1 Tax=Brachyistius frenatus TaxID=100188 RepID=UPI0037E72F71